MPESLAEFFSSRFFMPHGHCYLWKPALVWVQVLSNGFIGLSYVVIASTLAYLVRKVGDIPFRAMYLAFGVFIITCGITHFFDVYVIWNPAYWIDGSVRIVTAIASVGTAIMLPPLIPKALALARGAKAAHERGIALESMVKDLGTMYEKSKELDQLKTQFFANVSHELRTPLTLVLGPVEKWLASGALNAEQSRDLEIVARNARTLLKHVNDLLDVSKLEAGKLELRYSRVDLVQLARVTAANFDGLAQERGITFKVNAPPSLPAQLDAEKTQRVLLNLLSNAFKFTPDGGTITCTVEREGHAAAIAVADSGPGVPAEMRSAVFERFRQLDAGADRRFGGTGLGLAIAKDLVALHRGAIELTEAPAGGALFRISLPIKAPAGVTVSEAPDEAAGAPLLRQALEELRPQTKAASVPHEGASPRVLVVEDNMDMSRFIAQALSPDYAVDLAHDGQRGLARALEVAPDLVISDVMMPTMSGDQMVRAMREQRDLDGVPIVMLTAKADDDLRVQLLRTGAQDYLIKPFSVDELRARIKNLVTQKRARDVLKREVAEQTNDLERLAREIASSKRDLQTALASLRLALDESERALAAKTDFLNLVSHELRTPLTAINLELDSVRLRIQKVLDEEGHRRLGRLVQSTHRLNNLVESLLEYARLERTSITPQPAHFDLCELVRSVVDEVQPEAEKKQLAVELRVPPGPCPLKSDVRFVRLILSNLAGNAVKFTSQGRVELAVTPQSEPGTYRVTVTDTGPGIAPEDLPRIFEPFTHLEPLKGKHTPGFGLGLTLAKRSADAIGAALTVSSRPGEGTTFVVDFKPLVATGA